jgi:hypothetical protein
VQSFVFVCAVLLIKTLDLINDDPAFYPVGTGELAAVGTVRLRTKATEFSFTELLGFPTLSIVRILNNLKKNTTFRKLDLFPSSGKGKYLLCWVP